MRLCDFPSCERKHVAKGYCEAHRVQVRDGRPLAPIRPSKRRGPNQQAPTIWPSGQITYVGAHSRVRKLWGAAKQYSCIECGASAEEWAYDGTDPTPRIVMDGSHGGRRYSIWPEFYMPLCSACHRPRDRTLAKRELTVFRLYMRATDKSLSDIEKELQSYAIDFASKS